jgi:hypothetical protein
LVKALGEIDSGLVDRIEDLWGTGDDEEDDDEDEDDDDDDDGDSDGDDDDDDDDGDGDGDESWHGKIGGEPDWVQSPVEYQSRDGRPYRFLLQLDIDGLHDQVKPWRDAGMSGVLYVFVHPDEACAAAFWQYT